MSFLAPWSDGRTRAKICGLRNPADILFCQDQGAGAIGLNFWPKSKRYVAPAEVENWSKHGQGITRVGVFVNESVDAVLALLDRGVIHIAQLHGHESPEDCATLREAGFPVLKAIGVRDTASLEVLQDFDVDGVILDAFCPGEYGGSGKTFNWELALAAKELLGLTPLVLSGGLTSANVVQAIRQVRPHAVDVASGVESAPGVKSREMIADFLQAVASA